MCGRYTLLEDLFGIQIHFGAELTANLPSPTDWKPRFNIAPTQLAPVVTAGEGSTKPRLQLMRWGLIPSWAKDPSIGNRMINARAETLAEKPSFRKPLERGRCLVPVDGFYEWRKDGKKKTPLRLRLQSKKLFAFAGLFDRWKSPEGKLIESYTIITTDANKLMRPIHDRMPAILSPSDYQHWLKKGPADLSLLKPYSSADLEAYPVSPVVNSPANDVPACVEPVTDEG